MRARQFVASTLNVAPDLRGRHRPRAASGGVPEEARQFPAHQVDPLRPASRAARAGALPRRDVRSEHPPHAEMEPRRRDHGRAARGASGRDGEPRAGDRAVRLGAAQRARSDPGAARQAHDLCLARHAARARPSAARTTRLQGGVRRADHREVGEVRAEHDAQEHHRAVRLHGAANTRRPSRRCAAATSSWARSAPSR